ncbi:hypothetical protein K491DRAFT_288931 [Lophiostoma macrostomum CBS 122681]|uniref:Uncharacterized protein n=1 Tax=Lophiostoma macrostomum CBS 122681 TaxID=1314788 RepID=A0A6A6TDU1_9PLEO|nr:hypothetical protein K491DRAFT_288931 [Lophiostoma macrostomum CBS 122681]
MGPVGAGGVMRRSSWRAPGYDLHCAGWTIRSSEEGSGTGACEMERRAGPRLMYLSVVDDTFWARAPARSTRFPSLVDQIVGIARSLVAHRGDDYWAPWPFVFPSTPRLRSLPGASLGGRAQGLTVMSPRGRRTIVKRLCSQKPPPVHSHVWTALRRARGAGQAACKTKQAARPCPPCLISQPAARTTAPAGSGGASFWLAFTAVQAHVALSRARARTLVSLYCLHSACEPSSWMECMRASRPGRAGHPWLALRRSGARIFRVSLSLSRVPPRSQVPEAARPGRRPASRLWHGDGQAD